MSADLIARLRDHSWGDNITDTLSRWCQDREAAASALEAAEARIASVRDESVEGWQPIETAPRDGTSVLVFGDRLDPICTFPTWEPMDWPVTSCFYDGCWAGPLAGAHDEYIEYRPTHWRPLPAPPAPKQEGA